MDNNFEPKPTTLSDFPIMDYQLEPNLSTAAEEKNGK